MGTASRACRFGRLLEGAALALIGFAVAFAQTTAGQVSPQAQKSNTPQAAAASSVSDSKAVPAPANGSSPSWKFQIAGTQVWTDTGVDVRRGDRLKLSATGSVSFGSSESTGPAGFGRTWADLLRQFPINSAGRGALIGRIGKEEAAFPFLVGASLDQTAVRNGRLFLGINEDSGEPAGGEFHVELEIVPAATSANSGTAAASPGTLEVASLTELPENLLSRIPSRVTDQQGHPGDMVNFLILGPEDRMKQAFAAAGWVQVDRNKTDAVLHSLIATLSKQTYLAMPMSELYLFGRPQDLGLAHAAPLSVVATRHHLRLWKAPFQIDGQTLWVGAATHDIGFERDARNGGLTHRIDAAVDDERKFVADSLSASGLVSALTYRMPPHPLTTARTATGGSFHSDGRILILRLTPVPPSP